MQIMEAMEKPRTKIATQDENNRLPNFFWIQWQYQRCETLLNLPFSIPKENVNAPDHRLQCGSVGKLIFFLIICKLTLLEY